MKRITKSVTALFMAVIIAALSIATVFADSSDPVQKKSYSYSEKGNCTVEHGGDIYYSSTYLITCRFKVNDNIAVCAWANNSTPAEKTYKNATKYYVSNSSKRAKAFYWLLVSPDSTISPSSAKYNSSSKTFAEDLAKATNAAHSGSTQTYAFVHSLIDYLQQGKVNPYGDSKWNNVVKAVAAKTENYPNVPAGYKIFYFYPNGDSCQSLMSYDKPGHIQITKRSAHPTWTQDNSNYDLTGAKFGVYSDKACTKSVTTITCNDEIKLDSTITILATGKEKKKVAARGKSGAVAAGKYYIKETKAPKGFKLNKTVFSVTVKSGETATKLTNLSTGDTTSSITNDIDLGKGKLKKVSSNPTLTNGNANYSLEDAVYVIYYDSACTRKYKTMTTDDKGEATVSNLVPSTYYVKEKKAPKGFKLDTTKHTVVIKANETTTLKVSDEPSTTPPPPEGYIKIKKSSSEPSITADNKNYSLENAVYGIYSDSACKNKVGEIETDSNGTGLSDALNIGKYYLKEITASEGYKVDVTVYSGTVSEAKTTTVSVKEEPCTQTIEVLLQKKNATTGTTAHKDMTGAEYTVCYFTDYLEDEEAVNEATPERTWVLAVDENGLCKYDTDHLVSGDELYCDSKSKYVMPLGTVTIQETKAPEGFYLDDTLFIRQIKKNSSGNVSQYNLPVSNEFEIPPVSISGTKKWDDDNNRDGKRPKSITIELYREDELFDTATVSAETGWKYEFSDLSAGYADLSLDDNIYYYRYEVKEGAVEYYTSDSTGIVADPDDDNHFTCDFTNHYTVEKISKSGTKTWSDFDNTMGYRPQSIKVILNRDGVKLAEMITSQTENWSYEFNDLYKYHDGGKEYVYTVTEEAVPGYTLKVDGNNLTNSVKTGSVTLNKTDGKGAPMSGVKFKLFTESGKAVKSALNGTVYKFVSLSDKENDAVYTTNANGQIIVEDLPYGKYYFKEIQTSSGYMPYGEKLNFKIDYNSNATLNVKLGVENHKAVMPETGGAGNGIFVSTSAALAILGAALLCLYLKSKSKRKVELL